MIKRNRRLLGCLAILTVAVMIAATGCASVPARTNGQNASTGLDPAAAKLAAYGADTNTNNNGISVTGQGSTWLKPDVATFAIGVETMDADAQKARTANNASMKKVLDALKAQGVEDKDVTTTGYNMYARYDDKGAAIIGYTVSNNVQVKVRNLDKLGDVLTAVGDAGANTAGGISFDVQDRTTAYNQALAQAMEKARARADVIAKASGVKLGKVMVINESSSYSGPVFAGAEMAAAAKDSMAVPVSGGQLEVTASVNVSYEIVK
jgi:uncharacterized protein